MAGLSQQALADAAKVAKATIAGFEQGKRQPYPRTIADIQKTLEEHGVTFTDDGVSL
jgi:transcriptional regulator with XRE-family HTH domain